MAKEYANPFGTNATSNSRPEGWSLQQAGKDADAKGLNGNQVRRDKRGGVQKTQTHFDQTGFGG